jgi:hypothetical protein
MGLVHMRVFPKAARVGETIPGTFRSNSCMNGERWHSASDAAEQVVLHSPACTDSMTISLGRQYWYYSV